MINYDELAIKYKRLGKKIPKRNMIKTDEQILGIKEASRINNLILDEVSKNIHGGMTTDEINKIVHETTIKLGGIPAPLGYEGFPKSCCTSVNDEVCHGIPSNRVLVNGDIINVDVTTIYNGYYADASRMFKIGICNDRQNNIIKVTEECLEEALKVLKPFCHLGDIGHAIETHANKNGYTVVHEICGHGCGVGFHEDPFIPHFGKKGHDMVLFPGMIFTIEPMVNEGTRKVFLDASNNWTIYTADGKLSAQIEYMVLITEDGYEILSK